MYCIICDLRVLSVIALHRLSTNDIFMFCQAMKQDDKVDFVRAAEKEIKDHESRKH